MGRIEPRTITLTDGAVAVIRTAEPGDAAALIECYADVRRTSDFNVTLDHESTATAESEAASAIEYAEKPHLLRVVAIVGDRLAGELSFKGRPLERMSHHGHFGIGVNSAFRGRGVGTALLNALLDWARGHPTIEKVCLGVFAENHGAIALYRRLGFVEEARRIKEFKYGPGRYCDDIQMSLWVKPPSAGLPGPQGSA
jgi:RimJ/RimL family protein N-acetyltransferase